MTRNTPQIRFAATAALIAVLVLVPTALAGKPGPGGKPGGGGSTTGYTGTFSLVMVNDANGAGLTWNDQITFKVSSTAAYPMVNLTCLQGTTQVDNQNVGFYSGWPWSTTFTLSHWYYWPAGAADCTATLYYQGTRGNVTLSRMSFHVGA